MIEPVLRYLLIIDTLNRCSHTICEQIVVPFYWSFSGPHGASSRFKWVNTVVVRLLLHAYISTGRIVQFKLKRLVLDYARRFSEIRENLIFDWYLIRALVLRHSLLILKMHGLLGDSLAHEKCLRTTFRRQRNLLYFLHAVLRKDSGSFFHLVFHCFAVFFKHVFTVDGRLPFEFFHTLLFKGTTITINLRALVLVWLQWYQRAHVDTGASHAFLFVLVGSNAT